MSENAFFSYWGLNSADPLSNHPYITDRDLLYNQMYNSVVALLTPAFLRMHCAAPILSFHILIFEGVGVEKKIQFDKDRAVEEHWDQLVSTSPDMECVTKPIAT